ASSVPTAVPSSMPAPTLAPTVNSTPSSAPSAVIGPGSQTPTPGPYEQPPAGLSPTSASLDQVLALFKQGMGTAVKPVQTRREVDQINAYGLTGIYTEADAGNDFIETTQLGPTVTESGESNGQKWAMNENGLVRLISGVHQEDVVTEQAVSDVVLGHPSDAVRLVGQVESPVAAYVIEVHPQGGRHEWYFIERATGRLVRIEQAEIDERAVTTFDDFRTTDGLIEAWHGHRSGVFPKNDVDWRITSLQFNGQVSPQELAIPRSRSDMVFPAAASSVRLPARFDDSDIIVRVVINGRGLDFELDSGASSIVVDRDVVRQLGLQTFGESTQSVAGTFDQSSAIVPEMHIGDLTMRNVVVDSLPFNYQEDESTRVVGLLGYDFLASIVAKVDYEHETVDAFDPASFAQPSGQLFQLPMALDDSVPMVGAAVGGGVGKAFAVDTGSPFVIVFPAFASAHQAEFQDVKIQEGREEIVPIIEASGVGGAIDLIPTTVSVFHFGAVGFEKFLVFQVLAAPSFEGEDTDGLVGYEFLQYFTVFFDYRDGLLLLQPNSLLTNPNG
ncbi:MAG TPA: aspartyl protease family protein, partial [Candidatus Eremiobacteraceae bacterium]|nr:aspartyl protease family protein [Candidatus Eremiobacteraceae bacterium]